MNLSVELIQNPDPKLNKHAKPYTDNQTPKTQNLAWAEKHTNCTRPRTNNLKNTNSSKPQKLNLKKAKPRNQHQPKIQNPSPSLKWTQANSQNPEA